MKIVIANDHRGTKLKNRIINMLEKKGYVVENLGTNEEESVHYPEYAFKLGEKLFNKQADFGILICGTGIGMSIAANKVNGVRCALAHNVTTAQLARQHNDANVLAISASLNFFTAKRVINTFLKTNFSDEKRHVDRINMIKEYENHA